MGQTQSADGRRRLVAAHFSTKGWPAFMWAAELYARMNAFKMTRSALGQRVRFYDGKNMCIEYVRIGAAAGGGKTAGRLYQRVDGPCDTAARVAENVRTFPEALPGSALSSTAPPKGLGILVPVTVRAEYAEVVHPPTGRCAAYRRTAQGTWMKMGGDVCRDTRDELTVARALRQRRRPRR